MSNTNGFDDGEYLSLPGLDFNDLKPKKIRVPISHKLYILHEALASDVVSWKNKQAAMIRYDKEGNVASMGNQRDLDIQMVHLCTYYADDNGHLRYKELKNGARIPDEEYRVPMDIVRSWTFQVQNKLYETIQEISGLENDSEEVLESKIKALQKLLDHKKKLRTDSKNVLNPATTPPSEDVES